MKTAELNRRIENLLRLGQIAEVDHAARQIRVESGGLLTDWLPWPAEVGKNYIRWRPLRVGTQVILASISGDPAQAQIIGTLYTQDLDSPSTDDDIDLIQFDNGSYIQHNAADNSIKIHAEGNMTLSYDRLYLKGPVTQTGGDMTSDGISAQHHKTSGVAPGPGLSGDPV